MLMLLVLVAGVVLPSQAEINVEKTLYAIKSQIERLEYADAIKTREINELQQELQSTKDQLNDVLPYVAFNAYLSSNWETSRDRYVPTQVMFDQTSVNVVPPNMGSGGFDPSSATFTCPMTGYYNFYGVMTMEWVASARGTLRVYQNDNELFRGEDVAARQFVFDINTLCQEGDQISVTMEKTYSGSTLSYGIAKATSTFSGHLLRE